MPAYTSRKELPEVDGDKYFRELVNSTDIHIQNAVPWVTKARRQIGTCNILVEYNRDPDVQGPSTVLLRIDTIIRAERVFGYSVIRGSNFDARITEKIYYQMQIVDRDGGGCIVNLTVTHHTRPGVVLLPTENETRYQGFDILDDSVNLMEEKH